MDGLITFVHIATCVLLVIIVLLQQSKGDGMGSTFGSGGSQSVLGARGAATVITKVTTILAILFMCTSLTLAYMASQNSSDSLLKESTTNGLSIPEGMELPEDASSEVPVEEDMKESIDDSAETTAP